MYGCACACPNIPLPSSKRKNQKIKNKKQKIKEGRSTRIEYSTTQHDWEIWFQANDRNRAPSHETSTVHDARNGQITGHSVRKII